MITICLTYFRSLTLANLAAALYSVRRQDLSRVAALVVVDNNTEDTRDAIDEMIAGFDFPVPVVLRSFKHAELTRTHAWSTNIAVREAATEWVFFTRADYLLDFWALQKFGAIVDGQPDDWDGFVTSNGCHLNTGIETCETAAVQWRDLGPEHLRSLCGGVVFDYTCIDAGVWMARRSAFERVGGLNERLSAWGHAQTYFQYKLHAAGTECVRIQETLFYHPSHHGERNILTAHAQLSEQGVEIGALWARHAGAKPY